MDEMHNMFLFLQEMFLHVHALKPGSIHQPLSDFTFTDRAEDTFDRALQEICQGRKSSCWMLDSLQLCMLLDVCWFFLIVVGFKWLRGSSVSWSHGAHG